MVAFVLGLGMTQGVARAAEVELQATSAIQAYDVTDPWGDVILQRRRFLQTLGLSVFNLQGPTRPGTADYRIVVRMRLDSDFGVNSTLPPQQSGGETQYVTASGNGIRFIPGVADNPIDLMVGYVEGRNLAKGIFGFRLGRQYVADVLGYWSFDGGLLRVTTPFHFQLEVYGGLEQRGGLPLSTSRFEQQGVWRGNHAGFGSGVDTPNAETYPSFLNAEPARRSDLPWTRRTGAGSTGDSRIGACTMRGRPPPDSFRRRVASIRREACRRVSPRIASDSPPTRTMLR